MELAILNISGKETGRKVNLNDSIFGIEPNDHAIYLDTKQYLANQRQGTHKSKERGEITGSTRKLKRQKGTGTARAGSIKNPLFRGGGRIFFTSCLFVCLFLHSLLFLFLIDLFISLLLFVLIPLFFPLFQR